MVITSRIEVRGKNDWWPGPVQTGLTRGNRATTCCNSHLPLKLWLIAPLPPPGSVTALDAGTGSRPTSRCKSVSAPAPWPFRYGWDVQNEWLGLGTVADKPLREAREEATELRAASARCKTATRRVGRALRVRFAPEADIGELMPSAGPLNWARDADGHPWRLGSIVAPAPRAPRGRMTARVISAV
jgi:hypothetical protein